MKSLYICFLSVSVSLSALAANTKPVEIIEDASAQLLICPKMITGCVQMIQVNGTEYKLGYDPYANKNLGISKKLNDLIDEAESKDFATAGPIMVKGYLTKEKGFSPVPTKVYTVFKITAAKLAVTSVPKMDLDDCTSYSQTQRSELAVNAVLQALNVTNEQVTFEGVSINKISNEHSLYQDYSFRVGAQHSIVVQQYQDLDQKNQPSCALNRVTIDMGSSKSCLDEQKIETAGLIANGLLPFLKFVGNNVSFDKKTENTYTSNESTSNERFLFDSETRGVAVEYAQSRFDSNSCELSQVTFYLPFIPNVL